MNKGRIVIPKVWRSEIRILIGFWISCLACMLLSWKFPGSVISGRLLTIGGRSLDLTLPMFAIVPFVLLALAAIRIYDVRYVIDSRGLESRIGILGFHQRTVRVRFNDIRSAETEQTLLERVFDVGDVEVGTAATADIEIVFEGVAAPHEVQDMIQRERDRALELLQQGGSTGGEHDGA